MPYVAAGRCDDVDAECCLQIITPSNHEQEAFQKLALVLPRRSRHNQLVVIELEDLSDTIVCAPRPQTGAALVGMTVYTANPNRVGMDSGSTSSRMIQMAPSWISAQDGDGLSGCALCSTSSFECHSAHCCDGIEASTRATWVFRSEWQIEDAH
jgi:hypothetical protein